MMRKILFFFITLSIVVRCSHESQFIRFDSIPPELRSIDSLSTIPPFRASGKVYAIREDIRYRARWAFAVHSGTLRIQAFEQNGTMFADIATMDDSICVLVPSTHECHCGPLKHVPLADLLGVDIDWNAACTGLWRILYPIRDAPGPWIPGRFGDRNGWFDPSHHLFVSPDTDRNLAAFVCVGFRDDRIIVEVEKFETSDQYTIPSKLVFSWPEENTKLWIDIERITVDSTAISVSDPCPAGSIRYFW